MTTTTTLPPHVLAIDDDPAMRELIADYLGENELRVTTVATGAEMENVLAEQAIDVVVLDLRLAGEDGMQIAKKLRETSEIPIIIVSGRKDEADRVMGLELGADDYVTKPFSSRELLARIRAVLRRRALDALHPSHAKRVQAYQFEGWEMNLQMLCLKGPDGENVHLSRGEFALLRAFLSAPRRVLSREQLLDLTHVDGADVYDRSIDVMVGRLRRKIDADCSHPRFIRTERSVGYYFDAAVAVVR